MCSVWNETTSTGYKYKYDDTARHVQLLYFVLIVILCTNFIPHSPPLSIQSVSAVYVNKHTYSMDLPLKLSTLNITSTIHIKEYDLYAIIQELKSALLIHTNALSSLQSSFNTQQTIITTHTATLN